MRQYCALMGGICSVFLSLTPPTLDSLGLVLPTVFGLGHGLETTLQVTAAASSCLSIYGFVSVAFYDRKKQEEIDRRLERAL